MSLKSIQISINGIRPMLMNSGMMADPEYFYVKELAKIKKTKSGKRTDAQNAAHSKLEWMGRLYWSDEIKGLVMPTANIEACIIGGARKQRLGKSFEAAVFVDEEMASVVPLHHAKEGLTKEQLYALPEYVFRNLIAGTTGQRSVCVRPIIPTGWTLVFKVSFDDSTIENAEAIVNALSDAGRLGGLGDWRPKFGRFIVESWKEVA